MGYTIKVDLKDGNSRQTSYEKLIWTLGLWEEEILGEPLKNETPQNVRYVLAIVKGGFPQIKTVRAIDESGNVVAELGADFERFLSEIFK